MRGQKVGAFVEVDSESGRHPERILVRGGSGRGAVGGLPAFADQFTIGKSFLKADRSSSPEDVTEALVLYDSMCRRKRKHDLSLLPVAIPASSSSISESNPYFSPSPHPELG